MVILVLVSSHFYINIGKSVTREPQLAFVVAVIVNRFAIKGQRDFVVASRERHYIVNKEY